MSSGNLAQKWHCEHLSEPHQQRSGGYVIVEVCGYGTLRMVSPKRLICSRETHSQSVEVFDVFADKPFVINDLHDFLFPRVDRVPHLCQIAL